MTDKVVAYAPPGSGRSAKDYDDPMDYNAAVDWNAVLTIIGVVATAPQGSVTIYRSSGLSSAADYAAALDYAAAVDYNDPTLVGSTLVTADS